MKVFLSYSEADEKLVEPFRKELREAWSRQGGELSVWNPASDITSGDNWALKHGRALETADAVVILLSPKAVKSDWVKSEIDFALGNPRFRHKVIGVLLRPTQKVPWILEQLPLIKASSDPSQTARKVVSALRKAQRAGR
jgi:hypothetical protein